MTHLVDEEIARGRAGARDQDAVDSDAVCGREGQKVGVKRMSLRRTASSIRALTSCSEEACQPEILAQVARVHTIDAKLGDQRDVEGRGRRSGGGGRSSGRRSDEDWSCRRRTQSLRGGGLSAESGGGLRASDACEESSQHGSR